MSKLEVRRESQKIFIFKKIFEFESAKQQAEKKKLNAFGMFAKFNPLKRPTEESVLLSKQILRYEPFWYVASKRTVNYTCVVTYPVPVHNPHATSIQIDNNIPAGQAYPVMRQLDKAKIDVQVVEKCHRTIEFSEYLDGLKREIKPLVFNDYLKKFEYTEVNEVDVENALKPLLSLDSLTSLVRSTLQNQIINASNIEDDSEEITSLYLYFRPVYAFEYHWSNADKIGVIEVDGLTGEIIENGNWFKNTFDQTFTRDNLIDLTAELASTVVPGGGTVIKIASKVMN
ncbi:hypothetical protein [Acinetobacter sp.]|jgi:hypothetical protein|uniref:hypothetical protein n=1 Tax=Acinetobacter sp. TaxID=472 RepID=UPI0035B17FC4